MAFTWIIERMDCYPQSEGQTDVVFTVYWRVNAIDGACSATNYGIISVTYVAGLPYTPFADLTQAQVVGWVQDAMGLEQVANIETGLAANIADQINPPIVTLPLPWVA